MKRRRIRHAIRSGRGGNAPQVVRAPIHLVPWKSMNLTERALYLLKARCSTDEVTDQTGLSAADVERIALAHGIRQQFQKFDR
jgi:hypothetical protein